MLKYSLILFQIIAFTVFSQNSVQDAIDNFANDEAFKNASIGFAAYNLNQDKLVGELDAPISLPTASTAKLFSTASALELIGGNYKPITRLYYDGYIDSNGTLIGNIWIRGGGDPSLGSKYFYSKENRDDFLYQWKSSIKKLGIKSIKGNIIADASEFGYKGVPNGWSWNDIGNYYGAGPSGLIVYDNLLEYTFSVPKSIGETTTLKKLEPYIPGLQFHNYITSSSRGGDNSYLFGGPYSLDRFGEGTLPAGNSNFVVKGSIPDPEILVAYQLYNSLKDDSVICFGQYQSSRTLDLKSVDYNSKEKISEYQGKSLQEIISLTNHKSINLFAEQLVSLVGYYKSGDGSHENGVQIMEGYWKTKFNTEGLYITDGSGLSRSNGIAPIHFVRLLKYMYSSKNKDDFLNSLPISGKSGTLTSLCRNQLASGRIQAKSGTMSRIKSYAGYLTNNKDEVIAFSIIVNNANCSSSIVKRKMEGLFNAMVSAN